METTNRYLAVIVLLLVMSGCATSGGGFTPEERSRSSNNSVEVTNPTVTLAEYLQRVPGVVVIGGGANASIIIRGTSTLTSGPAGGSGTGTSPLFVIDGQVIGSDFAQAYQQVNMRDVKSIEILKGADAARYGSRGANGVVIINYE